MQLPKNIRQIGEATDDNRIYIEDYVYTYIRRMKERDFPVHKFLVLLGQKETIDGRYCYFISGTLVIEEEWFDHETGEVTDDTWSEIYKNIRIYFNSLEILGWAYIKNDFEERKQEKILECLENESAGNRKLILRIAEAEEPDEKIVIVGNGKSYELPGYFIYYEKNDDMQAYMQRGSSLLKEKAEPEEEEAAVVATRFRSRIKEKQETLHQRKVMAYLYMSSTFLIIIVFVIGVTMMNNYDKMKRMEATLTSISESLENQELQQAKEETQDSYESTQNAGTDEVIAKALAMEEAAVSENTSAEETTDETTVETAAETAVETAAANVRPEYYIVEAGDTLAGICRRFYGDTEQIDEICELNNIDDRDRILYGQKILLP